MTKDDIFNSILGKEGAMLTIQMTRAAQPTGG